MKLVYCYLDPSAGSIAYQIAIGGIVAAATAARIYWSRLKSLIRNLFWNRSRYP